MDTLPRRRDREWLDFVADMVADPLTHWPDEQVARLLVDTFDAFGITFYRRCGSAPPTGVHWPPELFAEHLDEINHWGVHHAPTRHPLLRYYRATGDTACMQTVDVPTRFADERVVAHWSGLGRRWGGVQTQMALPLVCEPAAHRAFVLGRTDPFTPHEMDSARRLQRLLVGLDRQITAFSRWSGGTGSVAAEVADALRFTPRELAVLDLLADGLTAASIGRRLDIAERTVQKHLQRCYAKLGVPDRLAAVLRAQHLGLLRAPGT